MSESAHLIWKVRCEWVIRKETITLAEVSKRHTISLRMDHDKSMSNPKYGRKALDKNLVSSTWKGILDNENNVPDPLEASETGVLVGILP